MLWNKCKSYWYRIWVSVSLSVILSICLVVFSLLAEAPHDVKFYWRMHAWVDLTLMALTFLFTIIWDVEIGIAVSVVISLLLVVHRSSKTRMAILVCAPFCIYLLQHVLITACINVDYRDVFRVLRDGSLLRRKIPKPLKMFLGCSSSGLGKILTLV